MSCSLAINESPCFAFSALHFSKITSLSARSRSNHRVCFSSPPCKQKRLPVRKSLKVVGRGGMSCSLACNGNFVFCCDILYLAKYFSLSSLALEPSCVFLISPLQPKKTSCLEIFKSGGQGWIRTTVHSREQIYSLSPLATRPPTHI